MLAMTEDSTRHSVSSLGVLTVPPRLSNPSFDPAVFRPLRIVKLRYEVSPDHCPYGRPVPTSCFYTLRVENVSSGERVIVMQGMIGGEDVAPICMPERYASEAVKLFVKAHSEHLKADLPNPDRPTKRRRCEERIELRQVVNATELVGNMKVCDVEPRTHLETMEDAILELIQKQVVNTFAYPSGYPHPPNEASGGPRRFQ